MFLRHLTSDLGKSQNTNLTFNRLFFAWINQKLDNQLGIAFSMVNPSGFWFEDQIKMLWRIKDCMYLRHLTSLLRKSQNTNLTFNFLFFVWINQKLHIQLEMTFSMVNPSGFWFEAQRKMLWRIKAWMYLRHLTSRLRKSQNTNLTFNRLFFAWIKPKLHNQLEIAFSMVNPSGVWFEAQRKML